MDKRPNANIVLNALAFAGLLVFASQAADAASTRSPSVDTPTAKPPSSTKDPNTPAVTDASAPDTTDTQALDDADVIGDVGNQDIETVDVGEIELPELETPDSN